jgi:diacylglycerol kinase (ATP)
MDKPVLPASFASSGAERKAPGQAVLIVNSKARRGRVWFEQARAALERRDVQLVGASTFRRMPELLRETGGALAAGVPLVILGGGDGTFSAVAHMFLDSESSLGVLPLGTGNAFARDLGIPADIGAACDILAGGRVASVDVGTVGDRVFLNVATVGVSTMIAQELTVEAKRRFGRLVYAVALWRALVRIRPFRAYLHAPGEEAAFQTLQVVIGNGRFHAGPFPIAPDASITEGRLSIYALAEPSRMAFLRLALHLREGRHVELPEVYSISATGGELRTEPPQPVTVDGEVCLRTPIRFGIRPGALRVVVPADFQG